MINRIYKVILMGILQFSKQPFSTPQSLTFTQAKELAQQTAASLASVRQEIRLDLCLDVASLRYNQRDWRKSTLEGKLRHEGQEEAVILDLEQAYRLRDMLKHLQKDKRILCSHEVTETPTPESEENKECCICFAQKTTTVLPCSHSYCATCTQRYIIDQEEHKCPQCRTEFAGNRDSIKRSFYELIEEDRIVFEEARAMVIQLIGKYNSRLERKLKQKSPQKIVQK